MIRSLANGKDCFHPVLDGRGWWQPTDRTALHTRVHLHAGSGKTLVIIDANTSMGEMAARLCEERGLAYTVISTTHPAQGSAGQLVNIIADCSPWAIINICELSGTPVMEKTVALPIPHRNDQASCIVQQARIIQLLQITTDLALHEQPVTGQPSKQQNIEILFQRLSSRDLPGYLSAYGNKMIDMSEKTDLKAGKTHLKQILERALDLLIDGAEGIWYAQNELDNQHLAGKLVRLVNDHSDATARKKQLKKMKI
jgi:hypothetical protein